MDISNKTMLEQAQMLTDYIRSQATDKPQNDEVVKIVLKEQQDRLENTARYIQRNLMKRLLNLVYSDNALERKTNEYIHANTISPLKDHINGDDFIRIKEDFDKNVSSNSNQQGVALELLEVILKRSRKKLSDIDSGKPHEEMRAKLEQFIDKEILDKISDQLKEKKLDLSDIDINKKTPDEVYKELSKIVDHNFVKEFSNKAMARVDKLADNIKVQLNNEHIKTMEDLEKFAEQTRAISPKARRLIPIDIPNVSPPRTFVELAERGKNIKTSLGKAINGKTGLEKETLNQAAWTEKTEDKPVTYKTR
ncbi:MAG: hypothetical protein R3D71_06365 [Rickettsiales bacterium]